MALAPGYLASAPVSATYTITSPPTAVISTVAGNGTSGFLGFGGPAISAEMSEPTGIAVDGAGNLYIADAGNAVVWKVSASTGNIAVVAGTGTSGYANAGVLATASQLYNPTGVAVDKLGNLYILDDYSNVYVVSAQTGIITTAAGGGSWGNLGDGGLATKAWLGYPNGIAIDSAGNLYISASFFSNNNIADRIRMVAANTGIISTVAGGGTAGQLGDAGLATAAYLLNPSGITFDSLGNLYIADVGNARIRKVEQSTGVITTVAGNGTSGSTGDGGQALQAEIGLDTVGNQVAIDGAGDMYFSQWPYTVRKVDAISGIVSTIAGDGYFALGGDGGAATMAEIEYPEGLSLDASGSLYIADYGNHAVRKVTFPGPAPAPTFSLAAGTYVGSQTVSISDSVQGAAIYYTTDGSAPTTASNLYGGAITVSATETLKAIAVASGYTESGVTSAAYTINQPVTPTIIWATPAAISYGTALGAAQLDASSTVAGSFSYSPAAGTVLGVGPHTVTATFTPTDTTDYLTATASVTVTVTQATPTNVLVSSANPAFVSNPVTFTATVGSTAGTPTGTVSFYDGTTLLGSGTLSGGVGTYATSALAAGAHSITAVYSGDSNFVAVTSSALAETIENFTLAPPTGGTTATAQPGGQATFTLGVAPPSGTTFAAPITFSVTGLPTGATAVFSPATIPAGAGATNVTLTVTVPSTTAAVPVGKPFGGGMLPVALGLILLPFAGRLRRGSRRVRGMMWLLLLGGAVALAGLTSCGGSSGSGGGGSKAQPQNYTLTITATSGSLSNTTTVTLTVE
jgi:sugar lactone lactonase YvrE